MLCGGPSRGQPGNFGSCRICNEFPNLIVRRRRHAGSGSTMTGPTRYMPQSIIWQRRRAGASSTTIALKLVTMPRRRAPKATLPRGQVRATTNGAGIDGPQDQGWGACACNGRKWTHLISKVPNKLRIMHGLTRYGHLQSLRRPGSCCPRHRLPTAIERTHCVNCG